MLSDRIVWFQCICYSDCYFFVKYRWHWVGKLVVPMNSSYGVTVLVVFQSNGWSRSALIVFVFIGGIVRASLMRTVWGSTLSSIAVLLTCIVTWGKRMRSFVVSMTTLLCLMKCKPMISPVKLFITRKCSCKLWSPMSNLSLVVAGSFSNQSFATWFFKLRG